MNNDIYTSASATISPIPKNLMTMFPGTSLFKNFPRENSTSPPEPLLTVSEVATWLNVSERTIREWVRTKKIPIVQGFEAISGDRRKIIRFQRDQIELLLQSGQTPCFHDERRV